MYQRRTLPVLTPEEVEARVEKDVRPDPMRIIRPTVDRYRHHQTSLVGVMTIHGLIAELETLLVYFYYRLIHTSDAEERNNWSYEWKRLDGFLLQLKTMYPND